MFDLRLSASRWLWCWSAALCCHLVALCGHYERLQNELRHMWGLVKGANKVPIYQTLKNKC